MAVNSQFSRLQVISWMEVEAVAPLAGAVEVEAEEVALEWVAKRRFLSCSYSRRQAVMPFNMFLPFQHDPRSVWESCAAFRKFSFFLS